MIFDPRTVEKSHNCFSSVSHFEQGIKYTQKQKQTTKTNIDNKNRQKNKAKQGIK